MSINLELYRIFYITAQMGSISKAAKALYTSQPAISQAIKQLEQKLGGAVFYRNARGVSLTVEGEVLYRYIEKGYNLIMDGEGKFAQLKQMASGQLRLAVCSAVCKNNLLEYIGQFSESYPQIYLSIKDESSKKIAQLLDMGKIDLGVVNPHDLDCERFRKVKSIEAKDCFVVGKRYQTLCEQPISIHQLAQNYPLIMLQKGGNTRAYMDEYFLSNGIVLNPRIELSNLDLMIDFAIKGLGVACVMETYVQKELESKALYKLDVQQTLPGRTLEVVVKKDMPLSTAAGLFIEMLCE